MNCWDELGITPTSEKRDIKRAYAKLLKTTKPDDNSEGFKALNAAYQTALNLAPYVNLDDNAPSREHEDSIVAEALSALQAEGSSVVILEGDDSTVDHDVALHAEHADRRYDDQSTYAFDDVDVNRDGKDDEIVASETPDSDAPEPWLVEPEAGKTDSQTTSDAQSKPPLTYQQLIYETQWLTTSRARNNSQRWKALLSEDVLIDWETFEAYSQFLFTYVSSCFVEKNRYTLSARMLRYLNDHFNWSNRIDCLESFATDEAIHAFQKILNQPPLLSGFFLPKVQQYYSWQLAPEAEITGAKFINGFILLFVFILAINVLAMYINTPEWPIVKVAFAIALLTAFIMMPCFERTRLQASPGYFSKGICLLKADGKTVTYKEALIRFLINSGWFMLSIGCYLFMEFSFDSIAYALSPVLRWSLFLLSVFILRVLSNYLQSKLKIIVVFRESLYY